MIEKMSLERFRTIKARIVEIFTMDSSSEVDEEAIIAEYNSLIKELLSHDLSDIPFEEWEDFCLWSQDELDFSLTHANLDFSLIKQIEAPSFNLKGCNVRRLEYIKYNKSSFDEDFIASHPEYFLPDSVPEDVQNRFYNHQLIFSDIYKYPVIRDKVTEHSFNDGLYSSTVSTNLIKKIGYKNAIRLFDENPRFVALLTYDGKDDEFGGESKLYFTGDEEIDLEDFNAVKKYIYSMVIRYCDINIGKHRFIDPEIFEQMGEFYPQYFISKGLIPEEDIEKFYTGEASIYLVVRYKDQLNGKDLDFLTRHNSLCDIIREVFGNLSSFLDNVPLEILYEVCEFLDKYGYILSKEENVTYEDVIKNALLRSKDNIRTLRDLHTYSKYVSLRSLCSIELAQMIEIIGFERLLGFNDQHNGLLDKTDKDVTSISSSVANFLAKEFLMSEYVHLEEAFDDPEKLYAIFSLVVENARKGKRIPTNVTNSIKEEFPQEFIDYRLARELLVDYTSAQQDMIIRQLENNLDSTGELLQFINKYPMLMEVVKKLDYSFSTTVLVFTKIKQEIGKEKLLEISTKYGDFIFNSFRYSYPESDDIKELIEIIKNSDDIEVAMNLFVNKYINDQSSISFDIRLLPKSFREAHPELFLREDVGIELANLYYAFPNNLSLSPRVLYEHKEFIKEVRHLDFSKCLSKITVFANIREGFEDVNLFKALSKNFTNDEILDFISKYGSFVNEDVLKGIKIDLSLPKEEQLEILRNEIYNSLSRERVQYDESMVPQEFIEEHRELFLDDNAPDELKKKFYTKKITLDDLKKNPDWLQHLKGKNFYSCCSNSLSEVVKQCNQFSISYDDIIRLVLKFDKYFDSNYINLTNVPRQKVTDPERFIKEKIINSLRARKKYDEESAYDLFYDDAPDLFLEKDAPEDLKELFYTNALSCDRLQKNPKWIDFLKGKNLRVFISHESYNIIDKFFRYGLNDEQVLYLMVKYGKYLTDQYINVNEIDASWFDDLETHINNSIVHQIVVLHKEYDESAKKIIGELRPDLFLDDDAPEDLKACYYYHPGVERLNFSLLKNNRKRWLPYLKNKELILVFSKQSYDYAYDKWVNFFTRYGEEKALEMGMKNPDAIKWAVETDHLDVYEAWYNRLGFIPHKVVLMDFPVDRIDDFAASGKLWSQLMKIERHNVNDDLKSSLLKASMCFGVFDRDDEGYTKILQLFTDIPKTLSTHDMSLICNYLNSLENKEEAALVTSLLKKAYYYVNGDTYRLRINQQDNKEEVKKLRMIMEDAEVPKVLSPKKSHDLFGPFGMIYEPEFRDFLLDNMEKILTQKKDSIPYIGLIQKKWKEIKVLNSNRVLTLELALNYVKTNKYSNVQVGNKYLEKTIGEIGLSQGEFKILQDIYNFGKLRVASSIPRVEGTFSNYQYEVTRLDDPLPCAIGKLSNCCQELGNHAEVCMEHSMVSKDGRLFVIKDEVGNIVAQSWMWRNGNVLCFDNIEIPDKAFDRAGQQGKSKFDFAKEIFAVYKKVANDLMALDEKKYKELLLNGSITQEQYEQLVLAKVTVGLGNNDIASAIEANAVIDKNVRRVIPFDPPVRLSREMYTSDSETQYILAGNSEVVETKVNNISIYTDEFIILDDYNIKEQDIHALELLENSYGENKYFGFVNIDEDKKVVSKVAGYYGLEAVHPKIIKNANFAIMYEEKEDKIIIIEILSVDKVILNDEEKDVTDIVKEQLKLAFNQINPENKTLDITLLNGKAKARYDSVFGMGSQEKEGVLSHGSK